MTQVPLLVALYLVGLLVCFAGGPRTRPALCCGFAFPVGLAVAVFGILLLQLVRIPYTGISLGALLLVTSGLCLALVLRRGMDRAAWRTAAAGTALFAVVSFALSIENITLMTFDSHHFVMLGRVIAASDGLTGHMVNELHEWGVFQPIAHSMYEATLQDFLYALNPTFGASFLALFVLSLVDAARTLGARGRSVGWLAVLVLLAMVTSFMFTTHLVYIHTNLAFATYLFVFVYLFWVAELSGDPAPMPVAFLCLLAVAIQRIEAPLVVLIFIALTVLQTGLPRRSITPWFAAFTLGVIAWYETLALHAPENLGFLSPTKCHMVSAAMALAFLYWLAAGHSLLRRLQRFIPVLLLVGVLLALVAAFVVRPDHMLISTRAWALNLFTLSQWGQSWYAIVLLALLALVLEAPPHRQAFTYGVAIYFVFVLLIVLGREPYYFRVGDSANRMTLHVLPLMFFYVGLKTIRQLSPGDGRR